MLIKINIKCSTGTQFTVDVEETQPIGEFKKQLAEQSNIPAEQQRLIYSGHVLKDHQTIQNCSMYFFSSFSLCHMLPGKFAFLQLFFILLQFSNHSMCWCLW